VYVGLATALAVLLSYQIYLTVRVIRYGGFTERQRLLQFVLIWLLPVLGAAIVHVFLLSDRELPTQSDTDFTPQTLNDYG